MNNMPVKLREEMGADPFYHKCCFHGPFGHGPGIKIEWHHNLTFAGRQVQEKECILPLCKDVHDKANWKQVRERLDWIMLNRMTNDQILFYSKAVNLLHRREYLNEKYANEKNQPTV